MNWMFELRGSLSKRQSLVLGTIGIILLLLVWFALTVGEDPIIRKQILPRPDQVFRSYGEMLAENDLIVNVAKSIGLNMSGYVLAILITLPAGFIIGLYPLFRGLFQRYVEAIRFVPLTATLMIFIAWFGIGVSMKSAFMAFGIFIFLLPVVVQRIDEVKSVYLKTVYTLGSTNWQTIRTVYIPSVLSRLWDDIRIMTAISWTYIVFIESNGSIGGVGDLLIRGARKRGRVDKVFALLILIILIGVFQDKIFAYMDRKLFPHKYQAKGKFDHHSADNKETLVSTVLDFCWLAFTWISLALYALLALDEIFGFLSDLPVITYLFGDTSWVIHFTFLSIILYKVIGLINKQKS